MSWLVRSVLAFSKVSACRVRDNARSAGVGSVPVLSDRMEIDKRSGVVATLIEQRPDAGKRPLQHRSLQARIREDASARPALGSADIVQAIEESPHNLDETQCEGAADAGNRRDVLRSGRDRPSWHRTLCPAADAAQGEGSAKELDAARPSNSPTWVFRLGALECHSSEPRPQYAGRRHGVVLCWRAPSGRFERFSANSDDHEAAR